MCSNVSTSSLNINSCSKRIKPTPLRGHLDSHPHVLQILTTYSLWIYSQHHCHNPVSLKDLALEIITPAKIDSQQSRSCHNSFTRLLPGRNDKVRSIFLKIVRQNGQIFEHPYSLSYQKYSDLPSLYSYYLFLLKASVLSRKNVTFFAIHVANFTIFLIYLSPSMYVNTAI